MHRKKGVPVPWKRRIPTDLRWLRNHLERTGLSRGHDHSSDTALVEFCLQLPPAKWRRVQLNWQSWKAQKSQIRWAQAHLKGTAIPALLEQIKGLEQENKQLQLRIADLEAQLTQEAA
jgi:hypothetical protein